jgi:hypothetical protein
MTKSAGTLGWLAAAVIALSLVTAGCSTGGKDEDHIAAAAPTPTVDSSLQVTAPLPSEPLVNDPCSALSRDQATEIGLVHPGEPYPGQYGQGCRWQSAAHDANKIFIAPLATEQTGITGLYAKRSDDKYYEPTSIAGYPAAYASQADLRSSGTCALWVGVNDQLVVNINSSILEGPNVTDPCPVLGTIATAMIEHLKGTA